MKVTDPVAAYRWLSLCSRIVDYLRKVPGAIQGQGGDKQTFRVACILIHGFNLTVDEAFPFLKMWNLLSCKPIWQNSDLRHKLEEADKREDGKGKQRGYLLNPTVVDPVLQHVIDFCDQHVPKPATTHPNPEDITSPKKRTFAGKDASELSQHQYEEVDWLFDGVFSADQPTLIGAGSKSTKTTQLVDAAVAIATATLWLNHFKVSKRRKVLFITGESNYRAICKRVYKALIARGLDWQSVAGWLRIEAIEFPSLSNPGDQLAIASDVKQLGIEVVIIDPLYRGLQNLDTHRMAEVGDAIVSFVKSCSPASVIISHHVTKSSAKELSVPLLEDLSGAGLAESCGNWWLIGRNEKYKHDKVHDLSVTYGGRDEQSGLIRIVFKEETWTWEVGSTDELNNLRVQRREQHKRDADLKKLEAAKHEVLQCLVSEKEAKPKNWIEARTTSPNLITRKAIAELLKCGELIVRPYKDSLNREKNGLSVRSEAETQLPLVDVR